MTAESGTQQTERVTGRVWTIRLAPFGRPSAGQVKLTCSRVACPDQRIPQGASTARQAAVGHVKEHLARIREGGGPNGEAWCACRANHCAWHTPDATARAYGKPVALTSEGPGRCGGPVVLTVYADRAGRLWRIAETCTRCAASTPDAQVVAAAVPPPRPAIAAGVGPTPTAPNEQHGTAAAAVFSDTSPSGAPSPAATQAPVPAPRTAPAHLPRRVRYRQWGKIGQRSVPADLQPTFLRDELIELGDAFRAYQDGQHDSAVLAALLERKARAFDSWADVTGDDTLRQDARRAEKAAAETHRQRTGQPAPASTAAKAAAEAVVTAQGLPVEYLLTAGQAAQAREVLDYAAAHAPHPSAEARLAVLMLALRAARAGTGNITGQDLTGWLGGDAEQVLEQLVASGWLQLPGTVTEVLASRPEDPTAFTVPDLLPDQPKLLGFGKTTRSRISGWAQKVTGDRKLRKKKAGPAARLLALYTAAHARPDGHLGRASADGIDLAHAAAFCTITTELVAEHVDVLVAADWLTDTALSNGSLSGRLTERVLPLGGRL